MCLTGQTPGSLVAFAIDRFVFDARPINRSPRRRITRASEPCRCAERTQIVAHGPVEPDPERVMISAWPIDTSSRCGSVRKQREIVEGRGRDPR